MNHTTKTRETGGTERFRLLRAAVFAATVLLALPATQHGTAFAASLTVAQQRDPQNFDPIDTFLLSWGSIGSNIFDGLLHRTEELELKPGLATKWEFSDDNERIRFTLREGVTFHNGEPFNAEAVKYSFDRLLGEQGKKGPQRSNYTSIERVEVVDDHTVDFVMNQPDPVILTKLSGYGAMIVPPKYIEEVGEEVFDKTPVGTGPFKVVEYTPSVDVKLAKFDDYWGGAPKIDDLTIRFIPEPATRMSELLSGGVDISLNIPTSAIDTVEGDGDVELVSVPGPTVSLLRFKVVDAVTEDVRVRKAINMAIDRKAIIDALLKGFGKPIASLQSSKSFGYDPNLEPYPYDPAAAKALLKEAGFMPGTTIAMDMPSHDDTFREIAQAVIAYLGTVGVNVKLRTHERNVYSSEIMPKGQTGELFQFGWGGWTFDFDNTAYLLYHSGERWNPYINIAQLDSLLEEQRKTYDTKVREDTLRAVASYAHENALDVPLFNFETLYGVNNRVSGFVPAPDIRVRYQDVTVE